MDTQTGDENFEAGLGARPSQVFLRNVTFCAIRGMRAFVLSDVSVGNNSLRLDSTKRSKFEGSLRSRRAVKREVWAGAPNPRHPEETP